MQFSISNTNNKQLSINMIANIISYSSNIIVSFILTPFLIQTIGKETYSFYPIANTIVSYMMILTSAMSSMASRFVTVSLVQNKKMEADKYFSSTMMANLTFSFFILIPMILIIFFADKFMKIPINSEASIKSLFALIFSSTIINISASVFGIATFVKNRIDLRSFREIVTAILKLVLYFVLYYFFVPSIIYVGIVTLIISITNILFQYIYTKKIMPEVILSRTYISFFHTKVLLISSCWNAINSLGNILLAGMSMILSNVLYGVLAAGSYAIVNIVPQFVNGVIIMISGVFYPIITYKYAQNNKNELLKTIKTAQICVGIFGCSVISVFCSLATDFFTLWTPNENSIYLSFLTFLTILPHFSIACMWSLTNMNVVLNKVKTPAIYTLMSGVINVLVSILIYKLWAPGVASLPLISSFLQIIWIDIFIPLYACKNLGVKWNSFYPVLIKALFCSGLIIIIISNVKTFFLLDTWPKLILYSGISELIALFVFTLVLFGFKYILVVLKTHYS